MGQGLCDSESVAIDATVGALIAAHAAAAPETPAILSSGRTAITYRALRRQIDDIGSELRRAGIGCGSRVAILMPDGPELAMTIVAVACHATAIPLNPALTAAELDDLFASQRPEAVILADWVESAGRELAANRAMCRLDARREDGALRLALHSGALPAGAPPRPIEPDDTAFILRTSGTTARPKLVAITHRNLVAMAKRMEAWFALTPKDRVLSVLPLYYAQGLKMSLFVPLILGSSLACPPRTTEADFFSWLATLDPTWFAAGPTLHRAVLERARALGRGGFHHRLRLIVSAAAALPEGVAAGLREYFGIPVLDAFGMSEAGLVAANTVAPQGRKARTVGRPWRDELAIWSSERGGLAAADEPGEIVIRGPGVTPGYIDDEDANRAAFVDGWFHTGDVGVIDADGFLRLVGRVKEMINRGGEKIAPAEIDAALQRHPAVAEAASFAVPHPRLGEDVVAAAVLRPGTAATSAELRRFLQSSLVPFKIPRRIHLVESLPKGETGKVLRQELSRRFAPREGGDGAGDFASPLEFEIASLWERLLDGKPVGPEDDFFELGGDSILATQLLLELERLTGKSLPDTILFENATVSQLAESIVQADAASDQSLILRLQPGQGERPFFFADGDFWGGGYYVRKIARLLGEEYPCYALRSHGLHGGAVPSVEEAAADYLALIRAVQPKGPYRLGGHCNGGLIALELARRLEAAGERVELVVLVETISLNARQSLRALGGALARLGAARAAGAMLLAWRVTAKAGRVLFAGGPGAKPDNSLGAVAVRIEAEDHASAQRYIALMRDYHRVMARYFPARIAAPILCLVAQSHARSLDYACAFWRNLAPDVAIAVIPGEHSTCITTHADVLAQHIRERFKKLDRAAQPARDMAPAD